MSWQTILLVQSSSASRFGVGGATSVPADPQEAHKNCAMSLSGKSTVWFKPKLVCTCGTPAKCLSPILSHRASPTPVLTIHSERWDPIAKIISHIRPRRRKHGISACQSITLISGRHRLILVHSIQSVHTHTRTHARTRVSQPGCPTSHPVPLQAIRPKIENHQTKKVPWSSR